MRTDWRTVAQLVLLAVRSTCLGLTATPASSAINSLASTKLTFVAVSPTSRVVAGDSDVSCRPNTRSRGHIPAWQAAQW